MRTEQLRAFAVKAKHILRHPAGRIEWFVGIVGLVFGLVFLVAIPPMQGADESNQFLRAYQISEGNLIADYVGPSTGGISTKLHHYNESVGGNLPSGVVDFTHAGFGNLPQHIENKMTWQAFKSLAKYTNGTTRKDASFGNTAAYSPLAYAPQVIGIWAGKIISDKPIVAFYLARLAGLLAGLALIILAIRLMPFGKLPFAVFALLPMTIAQLPVVTADTMAVGFAFLAVAATLRFAFRKADMARRDIALLLGVFVVLGLVKPSLAPVALILLVLLRNTSITRRKTVAIIGLGALATVVLALGWNTLVKDLAIYGYQQSYPASNYAAQLGYILEQPLTFMYTLVGTFTGHYFDYAVFSFIGILGWADTALPMLAIVFGYINIAFAFYITSQSESARTLLKERVLAVGIFVLVFCMTATFMYLFCNNPKDNYVTGLQGRYLIPAAPVLILLAVWGKKLLADSRIATYTRRCLYASVALLVVMVWVTVVRFYLA